MLLRFQWSLHWLHCSSILNRCALKFEITGVVACRRRAKEEIESERVM